jgi:CheY-like chemotaxis protein
MPIKILWVDDEINLLKPHLLFLEKKGYETYTSNNATDAIEMIENENYDAVLIDENMPGMSGLEALPKIKEIRPNLPIIMVTKSEEEHIMEDAIGKHISDYLIKPVNPNQVLLSLKKILDSSKIISEKAIINYQQEFRTISMDIMNARDYEDWENVYKKLVSWELELENIEDQTLINIIETQKKDANASFFKFIEKNYEDWLNGTEEAPILSPNVFQKLVKPHLANNEKVLLILVDNLRYDQWKTIEPIFNRYYNQENENLYYSILPSATQYARNSFFAGLMPLDIQKKYPEYWLNDPEEGNKNMHEKELLVEQLKRIGLGNKSINYFKILNTDFEKKIADEFNKYKNNDLNVIVYNFIDILSHAKTDNKIVSEMIRDDKTYRSITKLWFENSYLLNIVKKSAEEGIKIIVTTDHGTIFVKEPTKVIGDKESSTNLRYKLGRQLQYDPKDVFAIDQPEKFHLPKVNVTSKYIFAKENLFLTYPKNYNHFVNYYKDTYQHGGISLEEMIIPLAVLTPKK